MWWLPQISDTHIWESLWFESMYTMQGKTWSTRHTLFTLNPRRVPNHTSHVVHICNLSLIPTRLKHVLHPKEVLTIEDRLARPLSWVTSFPLPHECLGVRERYFSQVVTQIHQLIGSIYKHAIGTFNVCLRGLTNRSLTDTGGGYNVEGDGFSYHTPWPFQPAVSTFHLRAPHNFRISIQSLSTELKRE
jgi:hypothetical protein